jgi:hypothetical protein
MTIEQAAEELGALLRGDHNVLSVEHVLRGEEGEGHLVVTLRNSTSKEPLAKGTTYGGFKIKLCVEK